jgi:hypothetical protein
VRGLRQGLAVRVQRAEGGLSSRRGSSVRKVFERAMLMIVVGGILWLFLFGSDRGSKVERGE